MGPMLAPWTLLSGLACDGERLLIFYASVVIGPCKVGMIIRHDERSSPISLVSVITVNHSNNSKKYLIYTCTFVYLYQYKNGKCTTINNIKRRIGLRKQSNSPCELCFFHNIGFNMVPSDPFMSHLATQLGYSAGEFQALQLIVLVTFGVVDYPLASCMLVHLLEIDF